MVGQNIDVEGNARISELPIDNTADSLVVVLPDGTLGVMETSTIQAMIDQSILNFGLLVQTDLQHLLDYGFSPFELLAAGVSRDSLYGKIYQGGLIFYLDDQDTIPDIEGMVCAPANQGSTIIWGCNEVDLPDVPNVVDFSLVGPGAQIGDGTSNSTLILSEGNCPTSPATLACDTYDDGNHDDWFLPSAKELIEMYTNVGKGAPSPRTNIAGLNGIWYYSSTESSSSQAFAISMNNADVSKFIKTTTANIRAVRIF